MINRLSNNFGKLIRFLFITVVNALGIYLLSKIIPDVYISSYLSAILTTFFIAALNAFIFPIFSRLTISLSVLSLGIGGLIINSTLILVVSDFLPGLEISGLIGAIIFVFSLTVVNVIVNSFLAIDDDETFKRNIIKKQSKKRSEKIDINTPGVIFLQIDGLAFSVLRRAIQSGNVPNISRWIREGKYRLEKWETDWQSQTGASQAGILMGNNSNIPAFRWYDKKLQKTIAFGNPKDLKMLEANLSNGKGLLFNNGASRGNLFSGNASDTMLTVSSIGKKSEDGFGSGYSAYYSNPYNLPRTITLFVIDILKELKSMLDQGRRDVWPRIKSHKKIYPLLRASMTVIQRDVIIQTLIGDIYKGKNVIYADLVGYDEVSHHTGPERHETLGILRDIDKQIGRLKIAIDDSEKKYYLVLLSDHGQTQGPTFRQMTGYGLDEYVNSLVGENSSVTSEMNNTEDANILTNAALEITKTGGLVGKSLKNVNFNKKTQKLESSELKSDIKVLASGGLGLVYFTKTKNRLKYEKIVKLYPNLIDNLVNHPLIGFILVDSENGAVVIGKNGKYYLSSDKVEGENPLIPYGENALYKVKRTNKYTNVADIMINSSYDEVMNEIYAFEEQVGSHGSMGGDQIYPFVFFPREWNFPESGILGAENLHIQFKKWLKNLGQEV